MNARLYRSIEAGELERLLDAAAEAAEILRAEGAEAVAERIDEALIAIERSGALRAVDDRSGTLVIGRRQGQAVMIGGVVVRIVSLRRSMVRLAITAPRSMHIVREELIDDGGAP